MKIKYHLVKGLCFEYNLYNLFKHAVTNAHSVQRRLGSSEIVGFWQKIFISLCSLNFNWYYSIFIIQNCHFQNAIPLEKSLRKKNLSFSPACNYKSTNSGLSNLLLPVCSSAKVAIGRFNEVCVQRKNSKSQVWLPSMTQPLMALL